MHQTTVRFGPDLWEALEIEGDRLGMSVAQYVREAALARLAYSSGRRGDPEFESALMTATGNATRFKELGIRHDERVEEDIDTVFYAAHERQLDAEAVVAQNRQVLRRAQEIREQSIRLRRRRKEQASLQE